MTPNKMNRLLYGISMLLVGCLLITACSSDETENPTSDCYISAFTLGTLKRVVTSSSGQTTYGTYNGNYYPMSIDQRKGIITNTTPLLTGTNLNAALCTITAKGTVVYAPASNTEVWTAYVSTDSINFSTPLLFRVYATNGYGYREYRLSLTVRTKDAGSYEWEDLSAPLLASRGERRAVVWNEGLLLLSADASNALHCATWSDETWSEEKVCSGTDGAKVASLQTYNNQLWMGNDKGELLKSDDGVTWTAVTQSTEGDLVTLLAASSTALYARIHQAASDEDIIATSEDGATWTEVSLEKDLSQFPVETISLGYTLNNNNRVLVGGKNADDNISVWNLDEQHDSEWILFAKTGDNNYILPWVSGMTIISYNNSLIAIDGGNPTTYRSMDNGITWKAYTELSLPTTDTYSTAVVYDDYIYTFTGTKMQRAHVIE